MSIGSQLPSSTHMHTAHPQPIALCDGAIAANKAATIVASLHKNDMSPGVLTGPKTPNGRSAGGSLRTELRHFLQNNEIEFGLTAAVGIGLLTAAAAGVRHAAKRDHVNNATEKPAALSGAEPARLVPGIIADPHAAGMRIAYRSGTETRTTGVSVGSSTSADTTGSDKNIAPASPSRSSEAQATSIASGRSAALPPLHPASPQADSSADEHVAASLTVPVSTVLERASLSRNAHPTLHPVHAPLQKPRSINPGRAELARAGAEVSAETPKVPKPRLTHKPFNKIRLPSDHGYLYLDAPALPFINREDARDAALLDTGLKSAWSTYTRVYVLVPGNVKNTAARAWLQKHNAKPVPKEQMKGGLEHLIPTHFLRHSAYGTTRAALLLASVKRPATMPRINVPAPLHV